MSTSSSAMSSAAWRAEPRRRGRRSSVASTSSHAAAAVAPAASLSSAVPSDRDIDRARPEDAPDDLLRLEDFSDKDLLVALWRRYQARMIYTWVGSVLVSVNPYRDVGAFKEDTANRYASSMPPEAPHLYATVTAALSDQRARKHAILITGESGSGKTEATRAILQFLAMRHTSTDHIRERLLRTTTVLEAFGNAHTRQNSNSSRFGKLIEVYLSAEAEVVGATLRPYMLETSRVAGDLANGERTYHVFYALRAALTELGTTPAASSSSSSPPSAPSTPSSSSSSSMAASALSSASTLDTSRGPVWARLRHSKEWHDLAHTCGAALGESRRLAGGPTQLECLEAFSALVEGMLGTGLRHGEIAECCRLVAAVCILADGACTAAGSDAASSAAANAAVCDASGADGLDIVASLLSVDDGALRTFLTTAEISVGPALRRERLQRARSAREVATLRASVAQELYTSLFAWLTRLVVKGISPPSSASRGSGGRLLGLLDLYGFEVFEANGFEQFLINYCNERLQQFFNRQVFACEAEEYASEGLDTDGTWGRVSSSCQLPAITLLEGGAGGSAVGIFGVINDRSRCGLEGPSGERPGSELAGALVEGVSRACGKHPAFVHAGKDSARSFGVRHFAGDVFYEAAQFVRKNASAHRPDIVAFLRTQGSDFVREVFAEHPDAAAAEESGHAPRRSLPAGAACGGGAPAGAALGGGGRPRRKLFGRTLINQFQQELNELCLSLESRQCRHVRCLKPNDVQAPLLFDDESVARQCKYSGLSEAARIRREGYAHRRQHRSFAARYASVLPVRTARRVAKSASAESAAAACHAIVQAAMAGGVSTKEVKVGRTKVFLREMALSWLDQARARAAVGLIILLLGANVARRRFLRARAGFTRLQAVARGRVARQLVGCLLAAQRHARAEEAAALAARRAMLEPPCESTTGTGADWALMSAEEPHQAFALEQSFVLRGLDGEGLEPTEEASEESEQSSQPSTARSPACSTSTRVQDLSASDREAGARALHQYCLAECRRLAGESDYLRARLAPSDQHLLCELEIAALTLGASDCGMWAGGSGVASLSAEEVAGIRLTIQRLYDALQQADESQELRRAHRWQPRISGQHEEVEEQVEEGEIATAFVAVSGGPDAQVVLCNNHACLSLNRHIDAHQALSSSPPPPRQPIPPIPKSAVNSEASLATMQQQDSVPALLEPMPAAPQSHGGWQNSVAAAAAGPLSPLSPELEGFVPLLARQHSLASFAGPTSSGCEAGRYVPQRSFACVGAAEPYVPSSGYAGPYLPSSGFARPASMTFTSEPRAAAVGATNISQGLLPPVVAGTSLAVSSAPPMPYMSAVSPAGTSLAVSSAPPMPYMPAVSPGGHRQCMSHSPAPPLPPAATQRPQPIMSWAPSTAGCPTSAAGACKGAPCPAPSPLRGLPTPARSGALGSAAASALLSPQLMPRSVAPPAASPLSTARAVAPPPPSTLPSVSSSTSSVASGPSTLGFSAGFAGGWSTGHPTSVHSKANLVSL